MSSHGTVMSLNAERVQAVDPGFDELVAAVRAVRPRLVDAWEATAVIESLGYTDARVQQAFGFSDTRAAGEYLYPMCRGPVGPSERWAPTRSSSCRCYGWSAGFSRFASSTGESRSRSLRAS